MIFLGCPDDKFGENCDIDCHCQVLVVIFCLFVRCPDDKFDENCDIDCHCQVPCSDILFYL